MKHIIRMLGLLLAVSLVTFFLVSISPIDPLQANVGQSALGSMSSEQVAQLESYWGVGQSKVVGYLNWMKDVLRGDFGTSLLYRQPVSQVVIEKWSNSFLLLFLAWIISGLMGSVLGILAGVHQNSLLDRLVKGYVLVIASTPVFWLALLLLLVFAVELQILPIALSVPIGMVAEEVSISQRITHAILPAFTLSITGIANITLHTREKTIQVMNSEYVLFARARGEETKHIVWRHGLRNIMIPALTLQFASISEIIGGSVLVEQVFSYPGLGQAAIAAGLGSDLPLLLGITLLTATMVFLGNTIANALYQILDPRMKEGGASS